MIVIWHLAALRDRDLAIAYLRVRNPRAAQRLLRELIQAGNSLSDFPEKGRIGRAAGTRELVSVHPYILVYEVDHAAKLVTILRLWHSAQDR